jgi:predicted RNA-binding protein YlqC (UPF0109 family)
MKKLLTYLVKAIVEKPEAVKIKEEKKEGFLEYSLKVHPEDMKIVIGKNGQTIRALRVLAKTKAMKTGARINLQLEEAGVNK